MTGQSETLLRSVRARISQIPGMVERPDEKRREIVLWHLGAELARLLLRDPPRLALAGEVVEIRGLAEAAAAAEKVRALAAARSARVPQLELFRR